MKECLQDFKTSAEEHIQSNVKLLDSTLSDEALRPSVADKLDHNIY
jgi:hypothetical protein